MYPNEARLRNLSYSSHIFCNILIEYKMLDDNGNETVEERVFENVNLGKIPIMID